MNLLHWDSRTGAPQEGTTDRSAVIGMLSSEIYKLSASEQMAEFLAFFESKDAIDHLDMITKAAVRECRREYDRMKKIPADKYREYVELTSEAETIWEKAKNQDDYELFRPYLEKIIWFNQEFVDLWGYEGNKYNTLLDYHEPGMTVEKLDRIFKELREKTVSLLKKITSAPNHPEDGMLHKHYEIEKQERFSLQILKKMGYNFEAGRLDESEHPFTISLNPNDVRITTHYYPEMFSSALFSAMHEGGHGLYEQNVSKDLKGTPLCTGTSMGIHESQSRFFENMIGRSLSFWQHSFEDLKSLFEEQLQDVKLEDFYKAINKVEPTLIRVEADELTYNLHIMIRYEIEKGLINGDMKAADLPRIWNEKMEEYLGITPPNNKKGVLQDVHWSGGDFGYFPSYSLGNIYSAQFRHALLKAFPDFDDRVRKGELIEIKDWLSDKIYRHGKMLSPTEIIM